MILSGLLFILGLLVTIQFLGREGEPGTPSPALPALRSPASVPKGDTTDHLSSLAMGISLASSFASLGRPGT